MKSTLSRSFLKAAKRAGLFTPGDRIGVAVSGGADSVALLRLLDRARRELGVALAVVHFDHRLRQDSAGDARFVEDLARGLGLAFVDGEGDVAQVAARKKWNLEDASRRLRYAFFAEVVRKKQATKIAVAHTMDDQAETVLARVLRGAGPAGLAGIHPSHGVIVRPLLEFRRADLREYLRGLGQNWREDSTNRDTTRQRARIRENLLPLLETGFSPRAVEHLATLARLSHEEGKFWEMLVEDRFKTLVTRRANAVSISVAQMLSPLELDAGKGQGLRSLTERLVRRLYRSVRGETGELSALHVEQVIHLATEGKSGKCAELPGGVVAERSFGDLIFSRKRTIRRPGTNKETQSRAGAYQYPVELRERGSTDIRVPELDTCFRLKVIDCLSSARETTMWRSILDFERLGEPLVLRSWKAGDNYRQRGRRKTRKLKEMFLAARVASGERNTWPVLACGGQVVWAKGMEPAADFCAQQGTRLGVLIEECKL